MAIYQSLKKFLSPKLRSFKEFPFRVVPAFEIGGVVYYEVEDVFNTPCMRALSAIKYYEEMRMKCTLEYLEAWTDAHDNLIKQAEDLFSVTGGKLNLTAIHKKIQEIKTRNMRLKERLSLALDLDLVYKLASVVYFDETESPNSYEMQYGLKKIERWKEAEGANSFFLRQPIQKLVPFLDGQEHNIQIYSEVASQIKDQDWKEVLETLSSEQRMKYTRAASSLNEQA